MRQPWHANGIYRGRSDSYLGSPDRQCGARESGYCYSWFVRFFLYAWDEADMAFFQVSYLFRSLGGVIVLSVSMTLTQETLRHHLRERLTGADVEEVRSILTCFRRLLTERCPVLDHQTCARVTELHRRAHPGSARAGAQLIPGRIPEDALVRGRPVRAHRRLRVLHQGEASSQVKLPAKWS